jgi:hypothetical protein
MTKTQAVSEVFSMALRTLSKKERMSVIENLITDEAMMEDIADIVITRQRRKEKSIPYESLRAELKRSGRL